MNPCHMRIGAEQMKEREREREREKERHLQKGAVVLSAVDSTAGRRSTLVVDL